jgi:hypothetical protein
MTSFSLARTESPEFILIILELKDFNNPIDHYLLEGIWIEHGLEEPN